MSVKLWTPPHKEPLTKKNPAPSAAYFKRERCARLLMLDTLAEMDASDREHFVFNLGRACGWTDKAQTTMDPGIYRGNRISPITSGDLFDMLCATDAQWLQAWEETFS